MRERLGIAGTGTIARGLATVAAEHLGHDEVVVWARSEESAASAREALGDGPTVGTDLAALAQCTFVVEAIAEDLAAKAALLGDLHGRLEPDAVLATTTSSLPIEDLAHASGRPERFAGLHVFNPVEKMRLVELAFPAAVEDSTRARARELAHALGKTAVEVPAIPGFVVNRLLFPYLFSAVHLLEETGMDPERIDECMTLGAGHPLGPLALLDLVGLDVSAAIGEALGIEVPARLLELAADGSLGRKAGRGFHSYPPKTG